MIAVGAAVMAWTNHHGPQPGVVRGSAPHTSGQRLYLIQLDADPGVLWQISEIFVFDVTDIARPRAQFATGLGTS